MPKSVLWAVPERYRAVPEWKELLEKNGIWKEKKLDVKATFEVLKNEIKNNNFKLLEFLVQMPHNWYYELPVAQTSEEMVSALVCKKGQKEKKTVKSVSTSVLARLVGPSSMKSRLDACLVSKHKESMGDMTVLCDFKVHQTISDNHANFKYDPPMISLAIPISESQQASDRPSYFTKIVAIDQGEAGLALCRFQSF